MKILFLAAEVAPFVTVGGLSQVMSSLPRALCASGNDVRLFTPRYGLINKYIDPKTFQKKKASLHKIDVPISHSWHSRKNKEIGGETFIKCTVSYFPRGKHEASIYFFENKEYYGLRENVFGYSDDHIRFALFSKASLEWLLYLYKQKKWFPEVIHCHDWHTAYFIELARNDSRYQDILKRIPIVLTVHNFKYQGNVNFKYLEKKHKDDGKKPLEALNSPKLGNQNILKRGLKYADAINTVSPTHALEVLTPAYAEGLDEILKKNKGKLSGILNGLDIVKFNPSTDSIIKKRFSIKSFVNGRAINKRDLQREFSLPIDDDVPLIAYSGRLALQKGMDMMLKMLPHLLEERKNIQFIVLGTGNDEYRDRLIELKKEYPDRIGLHLLSNFELPRKIFAGADMLLVPSIFEPGGIVALEALRYGAIPIVRRTGGLGDIIQDFDPGTGKGNGFSFERKDSWSLYAAIVEALTIYQHKKLWRTLVSNALSCDFSWEQVAKEYIKWYRLVAKKHK
ncbi:glycogen synthase [Patescibacteria group bacterium]